MVVKGPHIDFNYDPTSYTFPAPGQYRIEWLGGGDSSEGHLGLRIQIHAQLVRVVEVRPAHGPRVPVDHAEVHRPRQVRGIVGDQLARVAAARERDRRRLQPRGRAVGHALLEERLAVHAIHPALHHRGALAQVTHDRLLALQVVVDEVHLRQPSFGEEDLVGIADAQLVAAHLEHRGLAVRGRHCWKDDRS